MMRDLFAPGDTLLDITFDASVIEWRGPAPFYFAPIPPEHADGVRWAARSASYGWGCVPVTAAIGGEAFATSLFPREGGYLLPLKAAVRRAVTIDADDRVTVRLTIVAPE